MTDPPPDTPVHLVIPTHTSRHLEIVLAGVARQTHAAASIVLSCDVIDDEIGAVASRCAESFGLTIYWVRRRHQGVARLNQVRNNGVRTVLALGHVAGRLLIIDGDIYLPDSSLERHAVIGKKHGLVIASRVMLDDERTMTLEAEALFRGDQAIDVLPEDEAALARRHRRGMRQVQLRRLRLAKDHKPKIIGAHISANLPLVKVINGFDEAFVVYGMNDDEFGRRAYLAGATSVIGIRQIPAFHLYHPTREATNWRENPGYERWQMRHELPVRCEFGLDHPDPQHEILIDVLDPSGVRPADQVLVDRVNDPSWLA